MVTNLSIMGKVTVASLEAADHTAQAIRKQRKMKAHVHSALFNEVQDCNPQIGTTQI